MATKLQGFLAVHSTLCYEFQIESNIKFSKLCVWNNENDPFVRILNDWNITNGH